MVRSGKSLHIPVSPSPRWLGDAFRAYVGTKNLGQQHAAVRLLIVLDNRNPGAPDGEATAIQSVHKLALARTFGTITNVGTPCLKCFEVGTGRDLAKQSLAREPHFKVIRLGRGESQITGAQDHRAVVQSKPLQDLFGVARQ